MLLASFDSASAIQIEFDYTYDTLAFFDAPQRQLLETASRHVNRYVDRLDAVYPTEQNQWFTFLPLSPSGGETLLSDLAIPADTLKVFVGGSDTLAGGKLAATSVPPASFTAGTPQWQTLLKSRGQSGALDSPPTDFAIWGGAISFNTQTNWHFGLATEDLDADEVDFLSVAMHELLHVLGFGSAESFQVLVDSDSRTFTGLESTNISSSNDNELQLSDPAHWAFDTLSHVGEQQHEALMVPAAPLGKRRFPTALDRAALRDVGWQEAAPGDANLDRQFDATDILTVLQAGKYTGGELASWSDGDWNDDLVFDQLDIVAALAAGHYLSGAYAAEARPLLQHGETGEKAWWDQSVATGPQIDRSNRFLPRTYNGQLLNVPEPSTSLLFLLGAIVLTSCRSRNRTFHNRRHIFNCNTAYGRLFYNWFLTSTSPPTVHTFRACPSVRRYP